MIDIVKPYYTQKNQILVLNHDAYTCLICLSCIFLHCIMCMNARTPTLHTYTVNYLIFTVMENFNLLHHDTWIMYTYFGMHF